MIKRLRAFLAHKAPKTFRRRKYSGIQTVERISEIPKDTKSVIYIVERSGINQWAVLDCPCCTGHRITVTLRKDDDPHWSAETSHHCVTLYPSLWFHEDCKSHFLIKNNRVIWI